MSDQLTNVPRMEQRASGLWVPEALAEPPRSCLYCGCDETHACDLGNGRPCAWAHANDPERSVCSNPLCLAELADELDAHDDGDDDDDMDEDDA